MSWIEDWAINASDQSFMSSKSSILSSSLNEETFEDVQGESLVHMKNLYHRSPVQHYLIEKWRRGVEYGKLSPWHHLNRTHCQSNQTIPVFGLFGP